MESLLRYNYTILRIKSDVPDVLQGLVEMFDKYVDVIPIDVGKEDYTVYINSPIFRFADEKFNITSTYLEKLEESKVQIQINKKNKIISLKFLENSNDSYEEEKKYYIYRFIRKLFLILELSKGKKILHSGCVEYGGNGIAIMGNKFAGKTTTIINLIKDENFSYVSNDKVVLEISEGSLYATGIPIAMGIRLGTLIKAMGLNSEILPSMKSDNQNIDFCDQKKYIQSWNIESFFRTHITKKVKLRMFLIPRYEKDITRLVVNKISEHEMKDYIYSQFLSIKKIGETALYLNEENLITNNMQQEDYKFHSSLNECLIYQIYYNEKLVTEMKNFIKEKIEENCLYG